MDLIVKARNQEPVVLKSSIFTATLLDLRNEVGNGGAKIDQQVGQAHQRHHTVEKVGVVFEVAT